MLAATFCKARCVSAHRSRHAQKLMKYSSSRYLNSSTKLQVQNLPSEPPSHTFSAEGLSEVVTGRRKSGQTKTFFNQGNLPRLPIPELQKTAEKYLRTIQPLQSDAEFQESKKKVLEFIEPGGWGEILQKRLHEYDKKQKYHWLEDIWLNKAYLEYRESVVINSNWWAEVLDHPLHPPELLDRPPKPGNFSDFQIKRAAGFIYDMVKFKTHLDNELIPPEYSKGRPLDMFQYKMQFGTTRIPKIPRDELFNQFPAKGKHIVLCVMDQIFIVNVMGNDGKQFTIKEIETLLQQAVNEAISLGENLEAPVGILTSEHRDSWSKTFEQLQSASSGNRENLEKIKTGLFAVSLDNYSAPSREESHRNIFHGVNGRNRWFDKSISIIFTSDGRAGCNAEHSASDAVVPANILAYVISKEYRAVSKIDKLVAEALAAEKAVKEARLSGKNVEQQAQAAEKAAKEASEALARNRPQPDLPPRGDLPSPLLLKWDVTIDLVEKIKSAENRTKNDITDIETALYWHQDYGSDFIKKEVKVSPDAFVQMAMQYAYYKQHEECCPTYETAAVRFFRHGRTECTRVLSNESLAFVKTVTDKKKTVEEKRSSLQDAVSSHVKYMTEASLGQGIDRHFLGLRCMMDPSKDKDNELVTVKNRAFPPAIFQDPIFNYSSFHWKLSTSNMSPGDLFYGGFGPVVPDGYGINYGIGKKMIKFSISAKIKDQKTDANLFADNLKFCLNEMKKLFEK